MYLSVYISLRTSAALWRQTRMTLRWAPQRLSIGCAGLASASATSCKSAYDLRPAMKMRRGRSPMGDR